METAGPEKRRESGLYGITNGKLAVRLRGYTLFLLGLSYVAAAFTGSAAFRGLVTAVSFLALLQCLPAVTGITRYASAGLFGIGSLLLLASGADAADWCSAVTQNGKILTLMMFVPMLSIPFNLPRYRRALEHVLQRVVRRGDSGVYLFTHLTSHLIGLIANIACVSITYCMVGAGTAGRNLDMLARAAARGYSATCFWSPNSGAIGLVLAYWGGTVVDIIPVGLPVAALALAAGWLENRLWKPLNDAQGGAPSPDCAGAEAEYGPEIRKDFRWLVCAVTLLLGLVIILDWSTPLGILTIVPLTALVYPFVWAVSAGEIRDQWLHFKSFVNGSLPGMSNEVAIFLGAGFFAVAAGKSGAVQYLARIFIGVSDSPTLLTALIILMVVGLSLVGFHPVLTTTGIVASFTPQWLGLPASFLSGVVVTSFGLAITFSPFSACSLSLSNITGKDPFTVGVRWQWRFTLLMVLAALAYFELVHSFFYNA